MDEIFDFLGLNLKNNQVNKNVTKKMFFEKVDLTKQEEKIFNDSISKIQIKYILDSSNINIDAYIDEEFNFMGICYMSVRVKDTKHIKKIANIIQSAIPSPLVIFFEMEDEFCISTSIKKINQNDNSKVVVSDINTTGWINFDDLNIDEENFLNSISIKNLDFTNFYRFYKLIDDRIYNFINKDSVGFYTQKTSQTDTIKEIVLLDNKLKKIVSSIKKETQFNKKVKLNVEAVDLKKQIDKLKLSIEKN